MRPGCDIESSFRRAGKGGLIGTPDAESADHDDGDGGVARPGHRGVGRASRAARAAPAAAGRRRRPRRAGQPDARRLRSRPGHGDGTRDGAGAAAGRQSAQPPWLSRRPRRGARRGLNAMFADREVRAIFAVRGGWGSARILPHLDFEMIRANPKLLIGFSDITALHLALAARTDCPTIHGPNAASAWGRLSWDSFRRLAFEGATPTYRNPAGHGGSPGPAQRPDPDFPAGAGQRAADRRQPHRPHGLGRDALSARFRRRDPVPRGHGRGAISHRPDADPARFGRDSRPGGGRRLRAMHQLHRGIRPISAASRSPKCSPIT